MYCPKCKVNRSGDGKFCVVCGTALVNTPASPAKAPQKTSSRLTIVLFFLLILTIAALSFCMYLLFSGKYSDILAQGSSNALVQTSETEEDDRLADESSLSDGKTTTGSEDESGMNSIAKDTESNDRGAVSQDKKEQLEIPESGTLEYNGHTYYVYGGVVSTWEEAKQYCEERGGYLAVINDQAENDALYEYACGGLHPNAFFGYSDAITEGLWQWVENDWSTYANWGVNDAGEHQPNASSGTEDYAEFAFDNGTWNDAEFGRDTNRFICEWDAVRSH